MSGPTPKADGERRRRNPPTFNWTMLPADGRKGPPPKLPRYTPEGRSWLKATRDWWADLWSKPQATQWDPSSAELLARVIIYERMLRGEASASEISEARQIDDRHGLNPKSMLQLRWRIGDPDDPAPVTTTSKPARRKVDPRRKAAMKLIEGGA